jgi:hypothetical protein
VWLRTEGIAPTYISLEVAQLKAMGAMTLTVCGTLATQCVSGVVHRLVAC